MFQASLYPHIAAIYREELERNLNELAPRLLKIFYCYKQGQTPLCCNYCENEGNDSPCKYLLVNVKNLIEVLKIDRELCELGEKNSELFQDFIRNGKKVETPVEVTRRFKTLERNLKKLFSHPLYSLVEKDFLIYFKSEFLDLKQYKRKGRRMVIRKGGRPFIKNPIRGVVRSIYRIAKELNAPVEELGKPREAAEYFSSLAKEVLTLSENSLSELIDWYKNDERLEKVEKLARKLVHAIKESKPLKGKKKRIGDRRITSYTKFELRFWRENGVEEAKPDLRPLGSLTLDTFLIYPNPAQQYLLLEKQETELENRIRMLKEELNNNLSKLRNLGKFVELKRKSPIEAVRSIPSSCYFELDETISEIINRIERRKSIILSAKKPKIRDKKTRKARKWLCSVDPKDLERKLKKTWKISKTLEELEKRLLSVSEELNTNFVLTHLQDTF